MRSRKKLSFLGWQNGKVLIKRFEDDNGKLTVGEHEALRLREAMKIKGRMKPQYQRS